MSLTWSPHLTHQSSNNAHMDAKRQAGGGVGPVSRWCLLRSVFWKPIPKSMPLFPSLHLGSR